MTNKISMLKPQIKILIFQYLTKTNISFYSVINLNIFTNFKQF